MRRTAAIRAIIALVASWGVSAAVYGQSACDKKLSGEPVEMGRPKAIEDSKDYIYRTVNGTDLRLHVFFPDDFHPSDKRAAIVFFYGGGWMSGTVKQFVPQSKYLARRGMVAAVADYRVFCVDHSTPFDSVEDAREAIRWMRSHAAELGVDPSRIAAGGGSAGGHIALSSAVFDTGAADNHQVSAKPDALVLYNPATDLSTPLIHRLVQRIFGDPVADRIETLSPAQHVHKGLPPTIIFNGKADKSVPYATAEAYCERAVANGNQCRVVGYEGADHGFFNAPELAVESSKNGQWYLPVLQETDRFLTGLGYLQGPAPSNIPQP